MAIRLKRGMGVLSQYEYAQCNAQFLRGIFNPFCWQTVTPASTVAPPAAPTGDVLTVPPASGEEAQSTVDTLLNQQLTDQQALNADGSDFFLVGLADGADVSRQRGNAGGPLSYLPGCWGGLGLSYSAWSLSVVDRHGGTDGELQ